MKRIHIILFLLIGFSSSVFAQADKWEIYQAYQNTEQVEETNNHVFAVADSSLYAARKSMELRRQQGKPPYQQVLCRSFIWAFLQLDQVDSAFFL